MLLLKATNNLLKIILKITIVFLFAIYQIDNAFPFSEPQHKEDYIQILSYIKIYINENNPITNKIQNMIDTVPDEIRNLAIERNGKDIFAGGNHRRWGHWGLGGKIPKEIIELICDEKYNRNSVCYKKIRETWRKEVQNLIKLIQKELKVSQKKAKLIARLIYDTHALGDIFVSSQSKKGLEGLIRHEKEKSLKAINSVIRDLIKALEKLGMKKEAKKLKKLVKKWKKEGLSPTEIAKRLYKHIMNEGGFIPFNRTLIGNVRLFKLFTLISSGNQENFIKYLRIIDNRELTKEILEKIRLSFKKQNYGEIIDILLKRNLISRKEAFLYCLSFNEKKRALKYLKHLSPKTNKDITELIKNGDITKSIKEMYKRKIISKKDIALFKITQFTNRYYRFIRASEKLVKFASIGATYGVLNNLSCLLGNPDSTCISQIVKDSALYASTYYITNAILVTLKNGKLGIIVKPIEKEGGAAPIAMFVLQSEKLLYSFGQGYISEEKLKRELLKNFSLTVYGYVALAFLPGSTPVITCVMASEFALGYALDKIWPDIYERNLIYMDINEMAKFFGLENVLHLTSFNLIEYENAFKQRIHENSFNQRNYETPWEQQKYLSPFE